MKIQAQTIIKRNADLIFNGIDDEIVILSIENEEYYNLNPIGSEIWNYLAKPESVSDIVEKLSNCYDVSYDVCMSETIHYLEELYELGIIFLTNE